MKKIITFILLTGLSSMLTAQVTIGSGKASVDGALLQIKDKEVIDGTANAKGGLGMPRVVISTLTPAANQLAESIGSTSGSAPWDKDEHIGLCVYNINKQETSKKICPGLHVWNGTAWQPLKTYPDITERRLLKSKVFDTFTPLVLPSDAVWATLGKNPNDYPLGYIGAFVDNRPNDTPQTYQQTRFYVGYVTHNNTYEIQYNYSCDAGAPNFVSTNPITTEIVSEKSFEDGIWMAENLRASKLPNGTAINTTVIGGDVGSNSNTIAQYAYPNNDSGNRATLGAIYNWAAAVNIDQAPSIERVNQQGINEGARRQGICPTGWHLPSDRQWTDLENAILRKTSLFSSLSDIGGAALSYTPTTTWRGSMQGMAIKNTKLLNNFDPKGASKTANAGGFFAQLSGYIYSGSVSDFGYAGYFWTSSFAGDNMAWGRAVNRTRADMAEYTYSNSFLFSVRCKKDDTAVRIIPE